MIIGHLPAGYCLTTTLLKRSRFNKSNYLLITGLICSVLPDIDLLYFYGIDHRQHMHHSYWTHIPLFWTMPALVLMAAGRITGCRSLGWGAAIGLANILLHLALDSVASNIMWLAPFSNNYYGLFDVPSQCNWWVLNFFVHWTFVFEAVFVIAAIQMIYSRKFKAPFNCRQHT